MSSKTRCPNKKSREWQLLVEEYNGKTAKAYVEWAKLDGEYPPHILNKVEQEEGITPKEESYTPGTTEYLRERDIILQKSKTIIELKIKKLGNIMQGNETLTDAEKEFRELLAEMNSKDRKSTRLNSSHRCISYAVFCLKKKKIQ